MAVVERSFAEFAQARHAASGDGDDPAAALLARCRAYTRFALANPGPYRYLFSQHAPTGDPAQDPDQAIHPTTVWPAPISVLAAARPVHNLSVDTNVRKN